MSAAHVPVNLVQAVLQVDGTLVRLVIPHQILRLEAAQTVRVVGAPLAQRGVVKLLIEECGPAGYGTEKFFCFKRLGFKLFESRKRCVKANWFELFGVIGDDGRLKTCDEA